ncbi:MAG: hypothetical protein ACK5LK_12095 [Chthoniobacterales bacterium]
MKTAYEIAMEKLEAKSPTTELSEEQKKRLAETTSLYESKIAEKKLLLEPEIAKNANNPAEVEMLRRQLRSEITRLEEEAEKLKSKIRKDKLSGE